MEAFRSRDEMCYIEPQIANMKRYPKPMAVLSPIQYDYNNLYSHIHIQMNYTGLHIHIRLNMII